MTDEQILNAVSTTPKKLPTFSRSRDGFSRADIVDAFHRAFHMVGGVQRLTIWANGNYEEFIKLYSKLLPSQTLSIGDVGQLTIVHAVPPTALDRHEIPAMFVDVVSREVLPAMVEDDRVSIQRFVAQDGTPNLGARGPGDSDGSGTPPPLHSE